MKKTHIKCLLLALIMISTLFLTACDDLLEDTIGDAIENEAEEIASGFIEGFFDEIFGNEGEKVDELIDSFLAEESENAHNEETQENTNDVSLETSPQQSQSTSTPTQEDTQEDVEEEPEKEPVKINEDIKNAILGNNATIKQIHSDFDGEIMAELFMGGTPIIYYSNPGQSRLTYYQFVIDNTDMFTLWSNASSHNDRGLPNYNLFPDNFTVDFMSHASLTMLKDVFINAPDEIANSRNISDLNAYLGVENEGEFTPGYSNAVMTVADNYTYTYHYDGITIIAAGGEEGIIDQFIMYEIGNEPDYLIY